MHMVRSKNGYSLHFRFVRVHYFFGCNVNLININNIMYTICILSIYYNIYIIQLNVFQLIYTLTDGLWIKY